MGKLLHLDRQLIIIFLLSLFTRLYKLGLDFVYNDDFHIKFWSFEFWNHFINFEFNKMFLIIQPAVLTVWFNIIGWKFLNFFMKINLLPDLEGKEYELYLHIFQKIPQALFSVILIVLIYAVIKEVLDKNAAFWISCLIIFEPFLITTTRMIQSDGILAYLYLLSSLCFVWYLFCNDFGIFRKSTPAYAILSNSKAQILKLGIMPLWTALSKKLKRVISLPIFYLFVSGFFGGLAFIEKSTALLLIPTTFILIILLEIYISLVRKKNFYFSLKFIFVSFIYYLVFFSITAFVFYPSFWGAPLFTIKRMTWDVYILGMKGFEVENFDFTKTEHLKSNLYYFWTAVIRSSTWLKIGLVLLLIRYKDFIKSKFFIYLISFPIVYLLVHQMGEKKIDRYLATVFIYFALYSGLGYYYFFRGLNITKRMYISLASSFIFIVLFNFIYSSKGFNQYYDFLFKNELFKNKEILDDVKNMGGYIQVAEYIKKNYGVEEIIASSDYRMLYLYYPGKVVSEEDTNIHKTKFLVNGCDAKKSQRGFKKNKDVYVNDICVLTIYNLAQ